MSALLAEAGERAASAAIRQSGVSSSGWGASVERRAVWFGVALVAHQDLGLLRLALGSAALVWASARRTREFVDLLTRAADVPHVRA